MSKTLTANYLWLSKVCEFWFMNDSVGVPFRKCAVSELSETLDAIGGESVIVRFRTTDKPKEIASDLKKFSKRLATVSSLWTVGEWEIEVIKGHPISSQRMCVLTRK